MAEKLVFPIGFDLERGLKQAQSDIARVVRSLDDAAKNQNVKLPVGLDETMAKKLREEAKDIERVLANIKNHYGNGQLKGLSIGFINTQKELDVIKRLQAQLQSMREQRASLVDAGATESELKKIDSAIKHTEQRLKELNHGFSRDNSFNIAISQQIIKLKNLSEELAGIDRMYARLQASAGAANQSANSYAANEILARRKEIIEEIARVTRTATEAQKELFGIKGIGNGASQGVFGYGGEQALSAITAQIERYEQLKKELQDVDGQYERLKAMQSQGMGDQSEKINQTLQRRIAIQKELGEITQTAAQAQKTLEENAKKSAAAFQRGRSAIDNFNRTMKLPENRIMNIQAKINALNQALKRVGIGSTEFNKIVAELNRLGQKLDEAKAKQQALTAEQEKGSKKVSGAFREQHSYLNILIQRLAVYSSLGAVMGFLTKVREVTAQFELQRISLGAIINDQVRANSLFNEIKQFALQSPIKILDLTKYTKQLAAFRFETDTLFESTKRLADISVGLSVPMGRLILALGHVKAATHLTGITLRQFSMAGIPMLELLAQQYSELEGRAVSVADVQKRVHDKMVSFEDVNQVFTDLTSKGGMFYNMQIKQGNTLYGLWAKLGDAASVMYEQIGNTPFVNAGMKDAINMLTVMMRNWRDVARVVTEAGIAFGIYRLAIIASTKATALAAVWNKKDLLLRQMHLKTVMLQSKHVRNFNRVLLACGVSAQKASTATWIFSRALNGLKAAIATTGIGLLIVGISLLIDRLIFGKSAADELAESLDRIKLESSQEQDKSVANFERLANVATSSTSSYKQQQEALEELRRTYKGMISEEMLTIENLKSLNGHYEQLTASIREYINQQMKQKQIDEITNTYAYDILKLQRQVRDGLKHEYSDEQLFEFWDRYAKNVKDKTKSAGKSVSELINLTVSEMGASMQFAHDLGAFWKASGYDYGFVVMPQITYLIKDQERQIEGLGKVYDSTAMALGKFADSYNEAVNKIKENGVSLNGNILDEKDNPLLFNQQEANLEVKDAMVPAIKEAFKEAGMAFDEGWISLIDNIDENAPHLISSIDFKPMIKKAKSETKRLQEELQKQLEILIAQREAYLKQIQAEERKGKGKNDEAIANAKAQYDALGESIAAIEEKAQNINLVLPLLGNMQKKFENIAPSDSVVKLMRQRFDQIVDYTKSYAKNMRRFRMDADESMEAYRKRLSDEVELIKKNIKGWSAAMILARLFRNKTEEQNLQNLIDGAKLQLADLEKILGDMPEFEKSKSKGGTKSDPRLQNLKEEISLTKKLYDEYHKLEKQIGATKAAEKILQIYSNTISTLQERAGKYGFTFELPFTDANLKANMQHFIDKMKELQKLKDKKGKPLFPNIGKEIDEAVAQLEDVDLNSLQKALEKKIKELADKISRTKTAKEFYEKILKSTRDVNLAENMTLSVFGIYGSGLAKQTADQVRTLAESIGKELPKGIINLDEAINPTKLREWADELAKIEGATEVADKLKKIADDEEKVDQRRHDLWAKDLEKAKEYADKRIELAQYTADQIAEIEAEQRMLDPNDANYKAQMAAYDEMIRGYREREKTEAAKLDYEHVKEQIGMFDDLGVRIGSAFEQILADLKAYTQSPDFARLGLEAQKNVYSQIAKVEDRMSEGFQGIGIGRVSDYVREYSVAASEYLTAQNELKDATLAAIEADKKYDEAKRSGNQATIDAALAEKQLANSRVASTTAAVNTAGAKLQRTQSNAARASERFNANLQKVESSLQSLNNGGLRALWDLLGDKGKRSVGEFLSGSKRMINAIRNMRKAMESDGIDATRLTGIMEGKLSEAMEGVDVGSLDAVGAALNEGLIQSFEAAGAGWKLAEEMASGMREIVESTAEAITVGTSGVASATAKLASVAGQGTEALMNGLEDAASKTGEMWGAIISLVLSLLDEFAEEGLGTFLGELIEGIGDAIEGILANLLSDSIPKIIESLGHVVRGVVLGLADMLTFGEFDLSYSRRIKKANKELERQEDILEELEYRYGRLEKAAEKLFGGEYISNYNKQMKTLAAEARAYEKQYEAERDKGKKADEDKLDEYKKSYRDTMDKIADMEGELTSHFTGTTRWDAAREFAQSWLEAKASFESTTDAMESKYRDMIRNMVVEGAAARVIEHALSPMWAEMDQLLGENNVEGAIDALVGGMDRFISDANNGMEVLYAALRERGLDMREILGDSGSNLRGISRDIANASEASINGLAQGINTQNFYDSQQLEEVRAIRGLLEGGSGALGSGGGSGESLTEMERAAMGNLAAIERHTAETVAECRAIAAQCEAMAADMHSVIAPANAKAAKSLQVVMK